LVLAGRYQQVGGVSRFGGYVLAVPEIAHHPSPGMTFAKS
jgi:hypothetical protein